MYIYISKRERWTEVKHVHIYIDATLEDLGVDLDERRRLETSGGVVNCGGQLVVRQLLGDGGKGGVQRGPVGGVGVDANRFAASSVNCLHTALVGRRRSRKENNGVRLCESGCDSPALYSQCVS